MHNLTSFFLLLHSKVSSLISRYKKVDIPSTIEGCLCSGTRFFYQHKVYFTPNLLSVFTVDAQRFYAKLYLVAQLITLDFIEKSTLVQNLQASTVETYNKVVSYRISSRIIKQCTLKSRVSESFDSFLLNSLFNDPTRYSIANNFVISFYC